MMNLLYIEITQKVTADFHKPVLNSLKEKYSIADCFDIDNHSESLMIDYACEFIRRSEKILVYLQAEENADSMRLAPVFDTMIKEKNKIVLEYSGENRQLERWLKPLR